MRSTLLGLARQQHDARPLHQPAPAPIPEPLAEQKLEAVMSRIRERWNITGAQYSIDDLAGVPPCPVCGARAGIVDGRLAFATCNPAKHRPAAPTEPTPAKTPLVQRDFGLDMGAEEWWNK